MLRKTALTLLGLVLLGGCRSFGRRSGGDHSRLAAIRRSGELRVGTTGDYKPYSFQDHDEASYSGIDVELAQDLARSLGVRPRLVKTSWPALMRDLEEGRFDVALSGISVTPERESRAYFSEPYAVSGKTPIGRCADRERFDSLEKIDVPGVRVLVNPGGTNEQFARAHFRRAQILVYPDNKTIFAQLAAGKADVMFTDSEEVKLQARASPALCPVMPGRKFELRGKAVLMPRDAALRAAVNAWLDGVRRTGARENIFRRFLGE